MLQIISWRKLTFYPILCGHEGKMVYGLLTTEKQILHIIYLDEVCKLFVFVLQLAVSPLRELPKLRSAWKAVEVPSEHFPPTCLLWQPPCSYKLLFQGYQSLLHPERKTVHSMRWQNETCLKQIMCPHVPGIMLFVQGTCSEYFRLLLLGTCKLYCPILELMNSETKKSFTMEG